MAAPELEGIGPASLVPTLKLDGAMPALTPEEGFLLSRVDGRTALGDLCLLVPFPREQTVSMLRRLWESGVLVIAGRSPPTRTPPPPAPTPTPPPPPTTLDPQFETVPAKAAKTKTGTQPALPATPLVDESGGSLSVEQRRRIDAFFAALDEKDAFALLEIDRTADEKTIRRAYFKLSKEFHPDRFFGKQIGAYKDRVATIFRAIKSAQELLEDASRRAAYLDSLPPSP